MNVMMRVLLPLQSELCGVLVAALDALVNLLGLVGDWGDLALFYLDLYRRRGCWWQNSLWFWVCCPVYWTAGLVAMRALRSELASLSEGLRRFPACRACGGRE